MKYDSKSRGYILDSGREISANCGILGMTEGSDEEWKFNILDGYDSRTYVPDLTQAERREIAEFMIGLWIKWGDA